MIDDIPIKDIEIMIEDAFNYENIRIEAVGLFNKIKPSVQGISEKGRIIYNPFRICLFDLKDEEGIEILFQVERIDEDIDFEILKIYKKCFVKAFDNLLIEARLVSAKNLLSNHI